MGCRKASLRRNASLNMAERICFDLRYRCRNHNLLQGSQIVQRKRIQLRDVAGKLQVLHILAFLERMARNCRYRETSDC